MTPDEAVAALEKAGLVAQHFTERDEYLRIQGGTSIQVRGGFRGYVNPFVVAELDDGTYEAILPRPGYVHPHIVPVESLEAAVGAVLENFHASPLTIGDE